MQEVAQHFLNTLFGQKPEEAYLLLWTLPDKRSYWFQNIEEMAAKAAELAERKKDVYVGVSMSDKAFGAMNRIAAKNTAGIIGLWLDVDYADPNHKKGNLPPDERTAMALMSEMGLEPTLTVHSGHGLQAWYLFDEPWLFTTDEEREKAQRLSQAWTDTLKAKSKARGWDSDSVYDLARVLRVAGTTNYKSNPVPVRILDYDAERRYKPSDFEEYIVVLPSEEKGSSRYVAGEAGPLDLHPDAQVPLEKWELLCEIESKFKLSWDRKRKDLQDQSGSSYDMSLSTIAAEAGWTDQEITNLLIAHRRKHGDDLKLRQDYYARTIHKARDSLRKTQADEVIEEHLHNTAQDEGETVPIHQMPEQKSTVTDAVSQKLGVKIVRIVKYVSDPPQFRLETAKGTIMLGEVQNLIGMNNFRNKVAASAGKIIPKFKPKDWDAIAQSLLNLCESEELGAEATDAGQAREWLSMYLDSRMTVDVDEYPDALAEKARSREPFVKNGDVYIFMQDFLKWLGLADMSARMNAKEAGIKFRALGCESTQVSVKIGEKPSTRYVWRLPKELS